MTVGDTIEIEGRPGDPFAYLYPYEFMRITTFRRDGRGVPTTVWFAHRDGKLYVTTFTTAGKIKRIRNTSRVLIAPCDRTGQTVFDKEIEARAHELPVSEHEQAKGILADKYGAQFVIITSRQPEGLQRTYFVVEPAML